MKSTSSFQCLFSITSIFLLFGMPANAQEVDSKIAEITTQFQEAYDRDVAKPHEAAVADLDSKYASALKRALDDATTAGNLEEALKLRTESDRLTQMLPLPPVDLDTLPDSLKQLRATYRAALAKIEADRDTQAQPFFDHYDKLLEALQTELTQAQKLDDALAVKAKRDNIALDRPKVAAPEPDPAMATTQTASPSSTTATTSPSAVPTSSSPWRAAAEWVLSLKGSLFIEKDGRKLGVQDLDKLPPGKFDILYVTFSRYSKHDGMKMTDADLSLLNPIAKTLERLTLDNCNINGSGLEAIASATKLEELSLYGCPVTDDALKHLAGLESLNDLALGHTQVTGTGFVHLRNLSKLKELGVNATLTTEEGGKALSSLTQVETLRTTSQGFKGSGAAFTAHVGKLTNLKAFHLGDTAATDACLEPLQSLSKLEVLSFVNSNIGGTGLAWLKASGPTLREIHLPYKCPVTDEAVEIIASTFPNLERLNIGYGGTCGPMAVQALATLQKLNTLTWDSKGMMAPADYALFAALPSLTALALHDADSFDEAAAAALATCPKVTRLTLPKSLTDAGLAKIATMKPLRELSCTSKALSPESIVAFKKARPDVKFDR